MRKCSILTLVVTSIFLCPACSDQRAAQKAKEDADAKARAEAARKEMDTLPKTFKSRDIFKKNEPEPEPPAKPAETKK
jgi:hypothetical protein